jgi:hypothetical protein
MNRLVGKARIGVIGVGWIGYRHAKYCGSHANGEPVGISDPGPVASEIGAELGVPSFASAGRREWHGETSGMPDGCAKLKATKPKAHRYGRR